MIANGTIVEVYEDPLTMQRKEGNAKILEHVLELDAVEPRTLADLARDGIRDLIDQDQWDKILEEEKRMRDKLQSFADEYENREDGE
jgi:ribosome recycling factor